MVDDIVHVESPLVSFPANFSRSVLVALIRQNRGFSLREKRPAPQNKSVIPLLGPM
jgi:hypothetical protein